MIGRFTIIVAGMFMLACVATTRAQDTRESAVAHMDKPDPKEMDPTYHKTAPLAQELVDDALAKYPQVLLIGIHAGAPKYWIIASNFGRLGKLGDEDDLRCIRTGKPNLELHADTKKYEVELPLMDKAGKTVGAVGIVFNYNPGNDKLAAQKTAESIRNEMKDRIASAASLFGPAT